MKQFIQKETKAAVAYYKSIPPYITQSASLFRSFAFLLWRILKVTSKFVRSLMIARWLLFKIINYFAKKIYERYIKDSNSSYPVFSEFQHFIQKYKDEFIPTDH